VCVICSTIAFESALARCAHHEAGFCSKTAAAYALHFMFFTTGWHAVIAVDTEKLPTDSAILS
jgi:hypothetical protein